MPSVELIDLPLPLHQVGYGCGHGSSDDIPWILSLLELVMYLNPGLLEVVDLFGPPRVVKLMQCFDVMQNDLIARVNVFVAVQVISAVKQAACMMVQGG